MPQDYKVYCVEKRETGKAAQEWCYTYSNKYRESYSIFLYDAGSAINQVMLLQSAGFEEVEPSDFMWRVLNLVSGGNGKAE